MLREMVFFAYLLRSGKKGFRAVSCPPVALPLTPDQKIAHYVATKILMLFPVGSTMLVSGDPGSQPFWRLPNGRNHKQIVISYLSPALATSAVIWARTDIWMNKLQGLATPLCGSIWVRTWEVLKLMGR